MRLFDGCPIVVDGSLAAGARGSRKETTSAQANHFKPCFFRLSADVAQVASPKHLSPDRDATYTAFGKLVEALCEAPGFSRDGVNAKSLHSMFL
jgi:hypothetical protein